MTDLSEIPLDTILDEIQRRCPYYVFGCGRIEDGGDDVFDTYWNGHHLKSLGLCVKLVNDINNHCKEDEE